MIDFAVASRTASKRISPLSGSSSKRVTAELPMETYIWGTRRAAPSTVTFATKARFPGTTTSRFPPPFDRSTDPTARPPQGEAGSSIM